MGPATAQACGGTFCDGTSVQNPMPVDQTGEDILFVRDGEYIEAHVRIQYTGAAERFAWMVPLPAVPEVSLGSEEMFRQFSATTIPFWSTLRSFDDPADQPGSNTTNLTFVPAEDPSDDEGPVVVHEQLVGQYEVVVLQGGTASEVIEFFIANDFAFEDDAEPLIQEYIDEGFLITGIKLTADALVEAIQPLVFRFVGTEPCVPIRLTSVAARPNMGIRAYFLGEERWAPSNYKHVLVNPMAYDWEGLGFSTYVEALSLAVDEAGGQAFATEYAGLSSVVSTTRVWSEQWNSADMALMDPWELISALDDWGFLPTSGMRGEDWAVMHEFLPPPENWAWDDVTFWYWLRFHPNYEGDDIDAGGMQGGGPELGPIEWDIPAFAAAFEERIIGPGAHAYELLATRPMLTRLHTTMSAHEMTLDPTFHPAPDLDGHIERRQAQARVYPGLEWTAYTVPMEISGLASDVVSEADLCVADDGDWPSGSQPIADMPRALRIEEIPAMGPPQVLTNNEAEIRVALQWHNVGSPCSTGVPPGGESESGSGDDVGIDEGGGCGCEVSGRAVPLGLASSLALLGLAGIGFAGIGRRARS